MSIPAPPLINEIDMELMLLVIQGYTSSYTLWTYVQENKTEYIKPVAYKNVNQRFLRLARLGYLEETKLGENPHRRIDYKLTMKGLEQLIPYILKQPEQIKPVVEYMNKFKLDKKEFGNLLYNRFDLITKVLDKYLPTLENRELKTVLTDIDPKIYERVEKLTKEYGLDLKVKGVIMQVGDRKENKFDFVKASELEDKNRPKMILDRLAISKFEEAIIDSVNKGLIEYDQKTKSYITTKKGKKYILLDMFKPSQELIQMINEKKVPESFKEAIETIDGEIGKMDETKKTLDKTIAMTNQVAKDRKKKPV